MSLVRVRSGRAVFSLRRIQRETVVRQAELHRTIGSTNARAMEWAADPSLKTPALVLAENQTAGRGRGANVWWSAPGALTFSLVLDLLGRESSTESWPRYALAAAVGICEALERTAPSAEFSVRWPNDVCADSRKICGILPELRLGPHPRLILGIGINVNISMKEAPVELRSTASSLFDLCGRRSNLTSLLILVLQRLETRLDDLGTQSPELVRAWSERSQLTGHEIHLRIDDTGIRGRCEGIGANGALLLRTPSGVQQFFGGTVSVIDVSQVHTGPLPR